MSEIIVSVKDLYEGFMYYDKDIDGDVFFDDSSAKPYIVRNELSKEKVKFIKDYLTLVMSTRIISDTTKMFIRSGITKAVKPAFIDIVAKWNVRHKDDLGNQLNVNTCVSKETYDSNKMYKYFPKNMINKLKNKDTHNIESYKECLYKALADYYKPKELAGKHVLNIPVTGVNESISDENFKLLCDTLKQYSYSYMQSVVEKLPDECKRYYNYLLIVKGLNDQGDRNYKYLVNLLDSSVISDENSISSTSENNTVEVKDAVKVENTVESEKSLGDIDVNSGFKFNIISGNTPNKELYDISEKADNTVDEKLGAVDNIDDFENNEVTSDVDDINIDDESDNTDNSSEIVSTVDDDTECDTEKFDDTSENEIIDLGDSENHLVNDEENKKHVVKHVQF